MSLSLKHVINEAVKQAMKSRDMPRLAALRLLTAAIKQKEVDQRVELSDVEIQQIIEKQIKQRRESIQAFEKAGRLDSAEAEAFEISVLSEFMPEQASEEEIQAAIEQIVSALKAEGLSGGAAMGKAMGQLKSQFAGKADMSQLSQRLKAALM